MRLPAFHEPRICGIRAVNASFTLLLISTLLSIVQQIALTDCDFPLAISSQWASFMNALVGFVAFYMAISDRSEKLMCLVILLTLFGMLQSILVAVIAFSTLAESETCISRQIRSWDANCYESKACHFFTNQVEIVHGGTLNGVIVEYATLLGAFAVALILLYILAIFSHFTVLKSFREWRKETVIDDAPAINKSKVRKAIIFIQ